MAGRRGGGHVVEEVGAVDHVVLGRDGVGDDTAGAGAVDVSAVLAGDAGGGAAALGDDVAEDGGNGVAGGRGRGLEVLGHASGGAGGGGLGGSDSKRAAAADGVDLFGEVLGQLSKMR